MPQANMPMLERLLVGAFAYFAEDSETIDEDTPPDISVNYEAVPSLGCIEQVSTESESEETEFLCPRASGGYEKTVEQSVTRDFIDMQVQNYNELVHRLQWGLEAAVVESTPVSPFAKRDRKVRGWLVCNAVKQDGEPLLNLLLRVEVRLNVTPPWENSYGKPTFRFQALEATDNAIEFGDPST